LIQVEEVTFQLNSNHVPLDPVHNECSEPAFRRLSF